ncbi:MAG TPA: protein kinase [Abditibacteriaceae bacterium]|jgi:serine/threonine-protein kinase
MQIGSQVGPYRVESLLGKGGMAEVYKVSHSGLGRHEAMKVLPPHMTFDKGFVERFLNEARIAASLQHPNIATIHSVSEADCPQPYFTMELVEGGDLSDLLAARGRLALDEALPILEQIGAALDYAHSRGFIHRDVKPANALLQNQSAVPVVKVVDFGIARAQEEQGGQRLTKTGMIIGTPDYMSPEQGGSGAPIDHRTDIYSLAVIAYEMLCGQPPFRSLSETSAIAVIMDHIRTPPPEPRGLNAALPVKVAQALMRGLAKEPAERPNSCAEFVATLKGTAKVKEITPVKSGAKVSRFSPTVLAGAFLLCGAVLIGFALGNKKDGDGISEVTLPGKAAVIESASTTEPPLTKTPAKSSLPQQNARVIDEVKNVVEQWRQARQARDGGVMASLYSSQASLIDDKQQSISKFQSYLDREKNSEQPRVEVEVSNVRVWPREPNQATVVFAQHFKGWGYTPGLNWESWGTRKLILWRNATGWKITRDEFTRTDGHRF